MQRYLGGGSRRSIENGLAVTLSSVLEISDPFHKDFCGYLTPPAYYLLFSRIAMLEVHFKSIWWPSLQPELLRACAAVRFPHVNRW